MPMMCTSEKKKQKRSNITKVVRRIDSHIKIKVGIIGAKRILSFLHSNSVTKN